jgi:hypothetical protein
LEELELDEGFDDSRAHRSGNLSQPNLATAASAVHPAKAKRASVDSALDEMRRPAAPDANDDSSGRVS